jgi:hypothetical protein
MLYPNKINAQRMYNLRESPSLSSNDLAIITVRGIKARPPLWSSDQSSWLQIQRSGFDSRRYHIFWVVGLERGALSLVSINELLGKKSSGSGLEKLAYGRGDPLRWPCDTLYPQKLALASPTSDGRSVGIVRSRTKATKSEIWKPCRP